MLKNSYEGVVTSSINTDKIKSELERLKNTSGTHDIVRKALEQYTTKETAEMLLENTLFILTVSEHDHIAMFTHPIKMGRNVDKLEVALDLRLFLSGDFIEKIRVSDPVGLLMACLRGQLESRWELQSFRDRIQWLSGRFGSKVFTSWISTELKRARQLTPQEELVVRIVTEAFWFDLFIESAEDTDVRNARIANNLRISTDQVSNTLGDIAYIDSLPAYLVALQQASGSLRLESVNMPLLLQILNGAWYGVNGPAISTLSTEYPPAFISMLMTLSVIDASWMLKSSGLGRNIKLDRDRTRELKDYAEAAVDVLMR